MPTIQERVEAYRTAVGELEAAATQRLVESYRRIYQSIQLQTEALAAEIAAKRAAGAVITQAAIRKMARYRSLVQQTGRALSEYGVIIRDEALNRQIEAAIQGEQAAADWVAASFPEGTQASIGAVFQRIPREAVQAMVAALQEGSPLIRITLARFGPDKAAQFAKMLLDGLARGLGPREIARLISNALGIPLSDALRIARTEINRGFRAAVMAGYRNNPQVVKGWTWFAQLGDPRTCMSCVQMHGSQHTLDETLDDHPNGRCVAIPDVVSLRELGIDADLPDAGVQTGEEWFNQQPEVVQRQMMGNAKYEAWANGEFPFSALTHESYTPDWGRTLTEASLKELTGASRANARIQ